MTSKIKPSGIITVVFILALVAVCVARADSSTDQIEALISGGKLDQALSLTEKQLAGDPANVNYLFLKGLILTRQNKMDDAQDIFQRLTKEHPELPEPYNNLAVIYAAQGDFTNARNSLERAINTHPSYATAHENLGDIYAKMASNAYNHALEIDSGNAAAREKLALINDLFSARPQPQSSKDVVTPAPNQDKRQEEESRLETRLTALTESNKQQEAQAQALQAELQRLQTQREQVTTRLKQESRESQQQLDQTRAQLEQLKAQLAQLEKRRELLARQVPIQAPTSPAEAVDSAAVKQEVMQAVQQWAAHWSNKDVNGYLASYAGNYRPPEVRSRREWVAQRRVRITKPRYIRVKVENPTIDLEGTDQALVNFDQNYQSDTYRDRVHKTLRLKRDHDRWLIVEEKSG